LKLNLLALTGKPLTLDYSCNKAYLNYRHALRAQEVNRRLYLAVPSQIYDQFFRLKFVEEIVHEQQILIVVYNIKAGGIQWIN
jgi:hypothetical protein